MTYEEGVNSGARVEFIFNHFGINMLYCFVAFWKWVKRHSIVLRNTAEQHNRSHSIIMGKTVKWRLINSNHFVWPFKVPRVQYANICTHTHSLGFALKVNRPQIKFLFSCVWSSLAYVQLNRKNNNRGTVGKLIPEFCRSDPLGFWRDPPSDTSLGEINREHKVTQVFVFLSSLLCCWLRDKCKRHRGMIFTGFSHQKVWSGIFGWCDPPSPTLESSFLTDGPSRKISPTAQKATRAK